MSPTRVDGASRVAARRGSTLVIIGNFDGLHRGHQGVLEASARVAEARSLDPLVLTFHPHPAEALGRGTMPVLTTLERKIELIRKVDPRFVVVVQPFDVELSRSSPEAFAKELLVKNLGARSVVVGKNFRFGRDRAGDLSTLERLGDELGFDVHAEAMRGDVGGAYSSTRVRAALAAGDLESVRSQLGRPHALSGQVAHGAGRGRSIGVPTANVAAVPEALPPYGVYACLVDRLDGEVPRALAPGVANIGERPTVQAGFAVEVHLFDFEGDLYGTALRLHLVARLREERRFPDLDALKSQIERDAADARQRLADATPGNDGAWF